MSDEATLMSLPPELRELIWKAAVVEPKPLTAYVAQRTIRVPQRQLPRRIWEEERSDSETGNIELIRLRKNFPELPTLFAVSRAARKEAMSVYYQDNIFSFYLAYGKSDNELEYWMNSGSYPISGPLDPSEFYRLRKVRLEFILFNSKEGRDLAVIDLEIDPFTGSVMLHFPGTSLDMECKCQFSNMAESLTKYTRWTRIDGVQWRRNAHTELYAVVSRELREHWKSVRHHRRGEWQARCEALGPCTTCGKPQSFAVA
ncbi:hypothetical protein LTR97_009920 [Elasticomyces elasticus]|uniref:2EXR domain-containing protein n=1 Tax=Elasticomyces elasticus TaxID=574655 RepID=A0AAN7W1W7_9PEZI|nr:hypothetical protein LTR97_009920 [Elasticomyces elasticus]